MKKRGPFFCILVSVAIVLAVTGLILSIFGPMAALSIVK